MGGIQDALVACVAVGGGHRALHDAEGLIEHLHQWRHAIGGAAGIADDVEIFMAILISVYSHHKSTHPFTFARGCDQYFFGTGLNVLTSSCFINKNTRGFNN